MSSVPVAAVDTHDDADLVQWLLASEMAQDVVFQSLVRAAPPQNSAGSAGSLRKQNSYLVPLAEASSASSASGSSRFRSSIGSDLALGADIPRKMVPPVELLEEERSNRHAIRIEYESSVKLFRHMHPAYAHQQYDWTLGGPRMTVACDRKMFSDAERHLPMFLHKSKRKDFFSKELGRVMEVKHHLTQSYQHQQQAAVKKVNDANDFSAPRSLNQSPARVIQTHAFLAVPVSLTHRGGGGTAPAPPVLSVKEQKALDDAIEREKKMQQEKINMKLRDSYSQVITCRESTVRHTLDQSEEFQRLQILAKEKSARVVAEAKTAHTHKKKDSTNGSDDIHEKTSPMRVEYNWESSLFVARNVAPPRPRDDVQRHLPQSLRRPNSASVATNQNKHPLTDSGGCVVGQQHHVVMKSRDVQSARPCAGPRPPPPTAASSLSPHSRQHDAEAVAGVLPRAVAAYRVHSAPVHRIVPAAH